MCACSLSSFFFLTIGPEFHSVRGMAPKGKKSDADARRIEPPAHVPSEPKQEPETATEARIESERVDRAPYKRIAIPVDEQGKINWEAMHARTREDVKKFVTALITDAQLAKSLGLEKPIAEVFPRSWINSIYDGVGHFMAALAPKMFGITPNIATNIFVFSEIEKAKLIEPTSAVINKYAADWLVRFKEEIALALLLGGMMYAKIMTAKMAQEYLSKGLPSQTPLKTVNGKDKEVSAAA